MKVSIITSCYNREATIRDAIESVLSQDYPNIEYIVVDGASKDNSLSIINEYKDRIAAIISEPDKGMYEGINKGMRAATGDVIGLIHSDDFFYSVDTISKIVKQIEEQKADILYGNGLFVDFTDTSNVVRNWISGTYKKHNMRNGWLPLHPTVYIRKGCFDQMWAAQSLTMKKGQRFITSGGLAPMGFSIPAAVGCAFANPSKTVYSINGDGGFHMAIQSLMLISQYNLPIKIVVINNSSLGMITQFQHLYFEDRMIATTSNGGYVVPNIKLLSSVYGLSYIMVNADNIDDKTIKQQILDSKNCIIEVVVDGLTEVSPKLEYNKPISQPTPQLPEYEFSNNMLVITNTEC